MDEKKKLLMKKTATIATVVSLFILFAYIFTSAFRLFLLLFGGILLSVFFHAISGKLHKWTGWNKVVTLILSVILVIVFWAGVSFFVGHEFQKQAEEFEETVPETIENLKSYLADTSWGESLLDALPESDEHMSTFVDKAPGIFQSTFGFFGDLYALVFLGVFLMISPKDYKEGFLSLVPEDSKKKAGEIIEKLGSDLKIWLKAQIFEMIFVFVLTAVGLLILGNSLWLILAIIAGILTFIPNIGPTLALIPAALVGLLEGPMMALIIIGLFLLVQTLESSVFGPYIRKKMLSLAPALVLFFQLLMGSIAGAWGLLFATPILVVLVNIINEVYVKTILGQEPVEDDN